VLPSSVLRGHQSFHASYRVVEQADTIIGHASNALVKKLNHIVDGLHKARVKHLRLDCHRDYPVGKKHANELRFLLDEKLDKFA